MRRLAAPIAAIAALALAGTPAAGAAPTPMPEHICTRPVHLAGQAYGVQGSGVRCNFMRFWTRRWLDQRGEPKHWRCLCLGEGGDCRRRHSDAWFEYYVFD